MLFVDLRTWNQNIYEKKYVQLSEQQIDAIHRIYVNWQTLDNNIVGQKYAQPELYYSADISEIRANNWSLVPSRYIEFIDRDTELDYETVLQEAGSTVKDLLRRQQENRQSLIDAFKTLGYDAE